MARTTMQDASRIAQVALQGVRSDISSLEKRLSDKRSEEQALITALQALGSTSRNGDSTGASSRRRRAGGPVASRIRGHRRGRATTATAAPSASRSAEATARGSATTTATRRRSRSAVKQEDRDQQVIAMLGKSPMSAMDLANSLKVTGRRSRQIIESMHERKLIKPAAGARTGGRGRPVTLWQPA